MKPGLYTLPSRSRVGLESANQAGLSMVGRLSASAGYRKVYFLRLNLLRNITLVRCVCFFTYADLRIMADDVGWVIVLHCGPSKEDSICQLMP